MRKIPAVLVCGAGMSDRQIAGLSVLDRLVITAHVAGCAPIFIVREGTPALPRARALGIETVATETPPQLPEPALMITGPVLVTSADLERVIERKGQLVSANELSLPVAMNGATPPPVTAEGVAVTIKDAASAREAERQFWASLASSADGVADRFFNRPIGRILSKILVHTRVTPNQVSIASILIGIASGWFFARGEFLLGAIVLQISAIVDCVDGELARALYKHSTLGKWLDLGGDQVVHLAVFAGLGIGVARADPSFPALALGASAAIGVLFCFLIIVRALNLPADRRSILLGKILDLMANRDFSVLLLVLALAGQIKLFLWLAGIGIHLFWMTMLILQMQSSPRTPAASATAR